MQRFPQQLGEFVLQVRPPWQPPVCAGASLCQFAVNVFHESAILGVPER